MKPFTTLAIVLVAVASYCRADDTPGVPMNQYKLAWSDEFDGKELDQSKWNFRTDSKMWSTQVPSNVELRDGKLILNLKKEDSKGKQYTGAGILSKQTFKYGYYEARFKVAPGAGWHTSFWLMKHDGSGGTAPKSSAQELDVCENNSNDLKKYSVNVHKWNPEPHEQMGHKNIDTPDLSTDFQVFGCEFTPQAVKYYFNGKLVQTVDVTSFSHSEQNIWLTCIASKMGNTKAVDESKLPGVAEFDYVRFYEKR